MKKNINLLVLMALASSVSLAGTMGPTTTTTNFDGLYFGLGAGFNNVYLSTLDNVREVLNGLGATPTNYNNSSETSRSTTDYFQFSGAVGYGKTFDENKYLGAKFLITYLPVQNNSSENSSYVNALGGIVD
jgi:hypothetical protein